MQSPNDLGRGQNVGWALPTSQFLSHQSVNAVGSAHPTLLDLRIGKLLSACD